MRFPLTILAGSGLATLAFAGCARDDTAIPFLTGVTQLAIAAAIFWQRLQRV